MSHLFSVGATKNASRFYVILGLLKKICFFSLKTIMFLKMIFIERDSIETDVHKKIQANKLWYSY